MFVSLMYLAHNRFGLDHEKYCLVEDQVLVRMQQRQKTIVSPSRASLTPWAIRGSHNPNFDWNECVPTFLSTVYIYYFLYCYLSKPTSE